MHNYGKEKVKKQKTRNLQNASIKAIEDNKSNPDPNNVTEEVEFEKFIQNQDNKSIKSDNSEGNPVFDKKVKDEEAIFIHKKKFDKKVVHDDLN